MIPDKNKTEIMKVVTVYFGCWLTKKFGSVYSGLKIKVVSVARTMSVKNKARIANNLKPHDLYPFISFGYRLKLSKLIYCLVS